MLHAYDLTFRMYNKETLTIIIFIKIDFGNTVV